MPPFAFPFTALVTGATLLLYLFLTWNVARARARYNVLPPQTDGPPEFLRRLRVQVNTLEHMIIFIPALWLTALYQGDQMAAVIGLVWPLGRIFYAIGYYHEAPKRMPGFFISMTANVSLLLIVLYSVVTQLTAAS